MPPNSPMLVVGKKETRPTESTARSNHPRRSLLAIGSVISLLFGLWLRSGGKSLDQALTPTVSARKPVPCTGQMNEQSLVIVQIETPEAAAQADEMAAVPGVDVLFVGLMDLSVNLGHPGDFSPPDFIQHLQNVVVAACERHGKTAGILSRPELVESHRQYGFRFLALGSDSGAVVAGLQNSFNAMKNADVVANQS